jgi:hypothetical protein
LKVKFKRIYSPHRRGQGFGGGQSPDPGGTEQNATQRGLFCSPPGLCPGGAKRIAKQNKPLTLAVQSKALIFVELGRLLKINFK